MNASRLVSVLLVLVAVVVLVVALVFFFEKKNKEGKEEEGTGDTHTTAGTPVSVVTLNVVTYLKDGKVQELRANPDLFVLDARATSNYQSNNVSVTVVSEDLENLPGYTKYTHTLPAPFKADGLVFDTNSPFGFFPHPLVNFTAYLWNTTVLFLTFKTVSNEGAAAYYHFSASPGERGLQWTYFQHDFRVVLNMSVLGPKLEEVNTALGNAVALNLDEFVDAASGTYTTEFGGVTARFGLSKRPYTQTDFSKLTHKLLFRASDLNRPFQLKKVLVSGTELNDLVLPKKPVQNVSVFWWFNVPLLAELDFLSGNKEYFVYNPDSNAWTNETEVKVRTKLTFLKNKLGVPMTVDLSKAPTGHEETYTSNEVLVRVSPNSFTNNAFPSFTHRFSSGQPHFVGSFVNAGTLQSGLPSLRVNQLTVFFSNGVPLVLKLDVAGAGSMGTNNVYYYNNGFGFWSKFQLTQEFATEEAVLNKLDTENKKLVAANDKYVVDVSSKSDYLSFGKPLKVASVTLAETLKDYKAYTHKAKNDAPFKFENLVFGGKDVKTAGLEQLAGVTTVTVYWFLNNPLFVKLEGNKPVPAPPVTPASPVPVTPVVPAAPGSVPPAPGNPAGRGVPASQPVSPPVPAAPRTTPFKFYFTYDAEKKEWKAAKFETDLDDAKLKTTLNNARATFGAATVHVGHGVGTYEAGPVTVKVTALKPHEKDDLAALDVMVHEFSAPFLVGKLQHFDFDMKLTHTVPVPQNTQGGTPQQQPQLPAEGQQPTGQQQQQQGTGASGGASGGVPQPPQPPSGPAGQQQTQTVPFPLDNYFVKQVDVFVFKYVPLMVKLLLEGGGNLMFTNNFTQSTWHKFDSESVTGGQTVKDKLNELKRQLTTTTSLDVCKDLKGTESVTYELPKTFGDGKVTVTLTQAEATQPGLKALTHTLSGNDVRLASLTCKDKVLTGLNLDQVQKVFVYLKGGAVTLVKTNSDPKFFVASGDGSLSRHSLPQGTTDLSTAQLGQLLTQVSHNLGPVVSLNLEATETYVSANTSVLVDPQSLDDEWNLFTHRLPPPPPPVDEAPTQPAPTGEAGAQQTPPTENTQGGTPQQQPPTQEGAPVPQQVPQGAPTEGQQALPLPPRAPPAVPHFTVSKFFQGEVPAVGLPFDKSYTDAHVVLKNKVPHVLGLKVAGKALYEWFVFNKYRWLQDFTTTDLLDKEDLLSLAKDVARGLDNEFDLDLSTQLQNEAFLLELQELPKQELEGFTLQNYAPLDTKYPVLLNTVSFNANLLSVPFLQSHHLNGFSTYMFFGEPVFLHAYTLDNKSLFFENGFEGEWKLVKDFEFTNENVQSKLLELKELALKFVTLNLNKWDVYRSFGGRVHVTQVEQQERKWAPFTKWEHTLPLEVPTGGATTTETRFKVSKVLFNGVDLKLQLPKGTATKAVVFANDDQVPLALYLHLTGPPKPVEEPAQGQSGGQPAGGAQPPQQPPAQNTPTPQSPQLVVTHNYFFNKAGTWEKLAENNAELNADVLKKKLTEAHTSLGFYVEADLGQKLPYVYTRQVEGNAAVKVVDFLVHFNPRDTFNFSTYTHVPQVRVAAEGTVKTNDFSPLVSYFTLHGQRLRGFDLNKVSKFTVYWLDDKFPLMVHVVTPLQHKFFRNAGDNNWMLLKTLLEPPKNADLFRALALSKQSFTFEASVEMGLTDFPGYWHKYNDGQVTLNVTKLAKLADKFNVFSHKSVSVGFPTFFLDSLKLWNRPVYGGSHFWFVHEVVVYTDLNNHPLLAEVVSSKFNAPKTPLRYAYLAFDKDAYSVQFLLPKFDGTARLNNEELLKLLNEVKESLKDVVTYLHLDAKANYNSLGDKSVTVGQEQTTTDKKFKYYEHTLPETKLLVLYQNGKRVGFDHRPTKFVASTVFWLGRVPVYVKFKHANQGDVYSHYFHWPNGTWNNTLPFDFNFTTAQLNDVLAQVFKLHDEYYTLDLGTKTVTSAFGDSFELDLVEYKHQNVTLPDELVGYSLLPASHKVFKLAALKVFGLDFKDFYLPLPTTRVMHAHVYSPDAFYAPLFLELVSVEPVDNLFAETKLRYDYFHATNSGKWSFLPTDGLRLDPVHMGFKLAAFTNPVPVMVDLGKREGTYGLKELTVTKVSPHNFWPFTKYVHNLANSDQFLVSKWVYNGVVLKGLPTLKATHVALYFFQDVVPLVVEVNTVGLVKFFTTDFNGNWAQDLVSRNSVLSYLNYQVHDLNLTAKTHEEWVPRLNLKLLREFELVPPPPAPKPAPAEGPEGPEQGPTQGAGAPAQTPAEGGKPTEGTETPPTQPETPVANPEGRPAEGAAPTAPQPAGETPAQPAQPQGPLDQSTLTTAALSPNLATQVAPGTAAEGHRVVTAVQTPQGSVSTRVEQTGPLATKEAAAAQQPVVPGGQQGAAQPTGQAGQAGAQQTQPAQQQQQQPTEEQLAAALVPPTAEQVPSVTPVSGVEVVAGAKAGVVPLAPPVPKAEKPKSLFRLVPLDYDKLFNGYLTLGKFVDVTRFETVPFGYRLARHSFLNKDANHLSNKFFVGDKLYSLPDDFLTTTPVKNRKANSLSFYSYLNYPLLLKMGFEDKKPVFFAFNKDNDSWNKQEVVNVDEELEHLNHDYNNVFVFDLGKTPGVHHPYFNGTTYYVSNEESPDVRFFKTQEYEAFVKVPGRVDGNQYQTYEQLPFRLGKLRHNGVDLEVDGLPLGKVFYTLRVHFSELLNKPLVFVLYPDQDEKDRKRYERENPGKYLGFHFHLNVDNTWTFFVPEGVNALVNKLKELEALFTEPPSLDLAKVTGTANKLDYWTKNEHLVVERLFLPPPPRAPPKPAEEPAEGAEQQPTPSQGAQPTENTQGGTPQQQPPTQQGAPVPQEAPQGAPTEGQPAGGQPRAPTNAPTPAQQVPKVDPLLGLVERTDALPADVTFTDVPLAPFVPVTGPEPASGFEWFYHHTPYFVKTVTVTPPAQETPAQPAPTGEAGAQQTPPPQQQQQQQQNSLQGSQGQAAPKTKKVVKVKRFQLGKLLNLGVPLNFEVPFEKLPAGWAGLTVLFEKNFNTPFLFALFNPKENSPDLAKAFYDLWVLKNMKWVKTTELEDFYPLFRSFELKLDLEPFNELLPSFYTKLNELSNQAKAPQTHLFTVDLGQADTVTQGGVVVAKDGDLVDGLDLVKSSFTPKLRTQAAGWVNFTLEKVTLFGNKYLGLDLPLVGVVEVNAYFKNNPDKFAKFATVLELVQKLPKDGRAVFKHWYYLYEDGNVWKLYLTTFNKLLDHEVYDLVNSKLYEYYRVSLLNKNALMLDLDARFSHLSLGRFVDAVDFVHDPSPNAPYSPVPEGFVLYRHSMVTENTTFLLPFMKFNGVVTKTHFVWPFVQYFVYYKVGENVPFVVVLAKGDNLSQQPTHHWYYLNGNNLVRFVFDGTADVDPDAQNVKTVVAKKFAQLLVTPPTPLTEEDPLTKAPESTVTMPTFPSTDRTVLSKPVNGVVLTEQETAAEQQRTQARRDHRRVVGTYEYREFLDKTKRNLAG